MFRMTAFNKNERGSTLVEFSIGVTVFVMAVFGVLEFGRALWAHNALVDAARRGTRYATLHSISSDDAIKNVVVYGDPAGGTQPLLPDLTTANVQVTHSSDFSVNSGTVTVSITDYQFKFVLPLLPSTITMPAYSTTLTGECAGFIP
jgi:Flp pilus assembly protein TadG